MLEMVTSPPVSSQPVSPKAHVLHPLTKVLISPFGVGISLCTTPELMAVMAEHRVQAQKLLIDNVNMDILWNISHNRAYRDALNKRAAIVLVDGVPVCWLAKLAGIEVPERMALTDVVPAMLRFCAENRYRVFVLGSNETTLNRAKQKLLSRGMLPDVMMNWSEPREELQDPNVNSAVLRQIEAAQPDVLFVAMGSPWQTLWIERNWDRLPNCMIVPVGGAFDYIAETVGRAPEWMQRYGLEWLYRLLGDHQKRERSLFERYVLNDIPYALQLAWQIRVNPQTPRIVGLPD